MCEPEPASSKWSSLLETALGGNQPSADSPGALQDAQLSLVHIPLVYYQQQLPLILKLLFPAVEDTEGSDEGRSVSSEQSRSWANRHAFLNVSVTPIECSIVCSTELARQCFPCGPASPTSTRGPLAVNATISSEDFVVISVEGEGLEAGQRVLELTSPLALAGMCVGPECGRSLEAYSDLR